MPLLFSKKRVLKARGCVNSLPDASHHEVQQELHRMQRVIFNNSNNSNNSNNGVCNQFIAKSA